MKKKPKIKFAPGAFDTFEGSQEELDDLMKALKEMIESGDLEKNSTPVDMEKLEREDPELAEILKQQLNDFDNPKPRKLN